MKKNKGRFTKSRVTGNKNNKWKGDSVGYFGLHTWLYRQLGKAKKCSECGTGKWVQWANISKKYKRDTKDWKQLCTICHKRFDGKTKLSKEQATDIKVRYKNGEKQVSLAREYLIDQGTISNLINNKTKYYVT